MGGNIAWTLRTKDGVEYRMDQWTNTMPSLIHSPDFLSGKDSGINTALEEWLSMKEDWEKNKDTKAFENPATPFYAPYPYGLKPSEYGLIVTDFKTQTILSLQQYSDLSRIFAMRLSSGPRAKDIFPRATQDLEDAARAGRVSSYQIFVKKNHHAAKALAEITGSNMKTDPYNSDITIVNIPGSAPYDILVETCDRIRDDIPENPNIYEIASQIKGPKDQMENILGVLRNSHKAEHNPITHAAAHLDLSPFTLEVFKVTSKGYEALRRRILELGFIISEEDNAEWDERIKECQQFEDG